MSEAGTIKGVSARECLRMLDAAGKIWATIREFMKRITDLEDGSKETKGDMNHLKKEVEILSKGQAHTDKIVTYLGRANADQELRIKRLESEKRGKAISAGKAKAKLKKLEEERDRPH
jgi:peptidoglycan hydrolase CwlO-like protein